jgi:hypothetical protein
MRRSRSHSTQDIDPPSRSSSSSSSSSSDDEEDKDRVVEGNVQLCEEDKDRVVEGNVQLNPQLGAMNDDNLEDGDDDQQAGEHVGGAGEIGYNTGSDSDEDEGDVDSSLFEWKSKFRYCDLAYFKVHQGHVADQASGGLNINEPAGLVLLDYSAGWKHFTASTLSIHFGDLESKWRLVMFIDRKANKIDKPELSNDVVTEARALRYLDYLFKLKRQAYDSTIKKSIDIIPFEPRYCRRSTMRFQIRFIARQWYLGGNPQYSQFDCRLPPKEITCKGRFS